MLLPLINTVRPDGGGVFLMLWETVASRRLEANELMSSSLYLQLLGKDEPRFLLRYVGVL